MPYIGQGNDGFGIRKRYFYTAESGDTSVTGSDNNGLSLTFTDGSLVDVYLNGVLLDPGTDYNTNTTNTIASLSSLAADDFIEVIVYEVFAVSDAVSAASGGTFGGAITSSKINASGDTSAGDNAAMGYTAAEGLILTGQGSTNDVTIKNDADTAVIQIPTGTDDVNFTDNISLLSDSAVLNFGADSDVTLTHNHNTGLDLNLMMTATTFEPDGDTSAGDNAAIGYTAAEGLILTGQGSTNDVTIKNDADTAVIQIPTGGVVTTFAGAVRGSTLTDTSNTGGITLDFDAYQNFILTFTGNVTLDNPTTEAIGQTGFIICIQDGTGSRTLSLGTDYESAGAGGFTLSTAASAVDIIPYVVQSSSNILLGAVQKAFS